MKYLLIFIQILIFCVSFSQSITTCGPNFGFISNSEKFDKTLSEFGVTIRRSNDWRYIQPEINLVVDTKLSEVSQMRIPILFGVRFFKSIRFGIGAELRSDLEFLGPGKKGMNQLNYRTNDKTLIFPMIGFGVDISRVSLDIKVSTIDNRIDYIYPQFTSNVSFHFGKMK